LLRKKEVSMKIQKGNIGRLSILIFTACLVASCTSTSNNQHIGIAGEYERKHQVSYFNGEAKSEFLVRDTLVLESTANDAIKFELEILADNGHTCSMSGVAKKMAEFFEYRETYELAGANYECVLRFCPRDDNVVLEDVDGKCRLMYCGMRGKIDGLTFTRAPAGK
jgi:hypothetical protein